MADIKQINYQKICTSLLKGLPERATEVIVRRFGLKTGENETLEAIGETYGITRERVRQIEREGLSKVKSKMGEYKDVLEYFSKTLDSYGGARKESSLVSLFGKEKNYPHILFLITLSGDIVKHSQDKEFYDFWARNNKLVESAKQIISHAINTLNKDKKPVSFDKIFEFEKSNVSSVLNKKADKKIVESYIEISKIIQKNSEGNFGLKNWVEINPKGIKDRAYLVFKKLGKALHFSEVAQEIESQFASLNKKAHVATVHNELIKDQRFVLVGRGLYALKEWGYEPGVVREIIVKVMREDNKPMHKDEIISAVLKQRMVKENTVFLNLQNKNYFQRDNSGRYIVKEA
ncbi:MAG: hypothetical protein NTW46_02385 [Candidatus Nealsonbacteria bacterium]|nr:hypothetical protein [Candidatus Nealsonbacteria bacterium]